MSSLYPNPSDPNPNRLSNYRKHKNALNTDGLALPLDVRDVPKFEKMNELISINLLFIGDDGGFTPLHVSKHPIVLTE